ncbi:helix-turn-helix transcriptional regulator [Aquirufa sp. KTFRIE-69F]|jgi:DNA-binding CsgD family transcriptional regulator|uniref:Helix-turn-helix transcriptional regulator n=1 Tax=Aquirufa originis TaxID=3096514 RepID=A0ABW6D989_9BACT
MTQHLTLPNNFDFTSREAQVIQFSKDNFTCKEIAEHLFISENTVRKHRRNIMTKIGVSGKKDFRKFLRDYPSLRFK